MIVSPVNSFVDFNNSDLDCDGNSRDLALPAYDNFGIKFQISIQDENLPPDTPLFAAICNPDCDTIYQDSIPVIPICSRFQFFNSENEPVLDSYFPILVGNYAPQPGQPQVPEGTYTKSEFLEVINELYGVSVPGLQFYDCCGIESTISDIVVFYNGEGSAESISLLELFGFGYINFPPADMDGTVLPNDCFRYCILDEVGENLACSNLFKRISDPCWTTVFSYYNEGNGYGFRYVTYEDEGDMLLTENQIRLFVRFDKPNFPIEENVFRRSDGAQQRLSTLINKEWLAQTGYLSDNQHEKMVVMLKHDILFVNNDRRNINRRMTQIGDYEPQYPDLSNYVSSPANFRISDYINSYVNNNCGFDCGVELVDDCERGGGVTPVCPDRFQIEFAVGAGQTMASYQNDLLIGETASSIEVYREGIFQYSSSSSYSLNTITGTVTFNPDLSEYERVAIVEI